MAKDDIRIIMAEPTDTLFEIVLLLKFKDTEVFNWITVKVASKTPKAVFKPLYFPVIHNVERSIWCRYVCT